MKKYFIIFLFFIINQSSFGEVINGGVELNYEYTKEDVSNTAFSVNLTSHLTDSDYKENISAFKAGINYLKDRKGDIFSDGSYGIMYLNNPLYSWYYSPNGKLISYSVKSSPEYPTKIVKYRPDGTIINISIKLSPKESYIYTLDGNLVAHWHDDICYDGNNNVIMTRKEINQITESQSGN